MVNSMISIDILDEIISIGKASKLLGVSAGTLRRWTSDGTSQIWQSTTAFKKGIEEYRTAGGYRRFKKSNLVNVLESWKKK